MRCRKNTWLGDKALYLEAMGNMRTCYSPDGLMTQQAAETVRDVLGSFDPRRARRRKSISRRPMTTALSSEFRPTAN